MDKLIRRLKIIIKEIGNFLANVAVPFISLLIAILGFFPVPTEWLEGLKKAEHWLFNVSGTMKDLEAAVEENAIEDKEKAEEKVVKKEAKALKKALRKKNDNRLEKKD